MAASVAGGVPQRPAHVSEGSDEPTQSITDIGRTQNRVHGSRPAPVGRHRGGGAWFAVVVGLAAAVAAIGLSRMAEAWGQKPFTLIAASLAAATAVSYHFIPGPRDPENMETLAAIPALLALLAAVGLLFAHRLRGPGARVLATCCIAALVGGTLFHAPILRSFGPFSDDEGRWLILSLLGITLVAIGVTDIVDRKFDPTRVAPGMRPNRTWKGAAAGVLGAVLFGVVFNRFPDGGAVPATAAVAYATLGVAAQLADLFFERLKRQAGDGASAWTFPGWRVLNWMFPLMWTVVVLYHFVAGFSGSTA